MPQSSNPKFDFTDLSDDRIRQILEDLAVGLTAEEVRKLQFEILGRAPTLAELILFGIEGSEHCSYKSSRPYLKLFETEGEDVILGAKEDAGVIRVAADREGNGYAIVMSHESHNHPSQIVPYEGAATGVGGNVRDVCCMGAEVIAQADDLRFGSIDDPRNKWIYEGVVSGIAGYGNPIGVPNIGGGLQFDPGYDDNCLVTVVSLGVLQEDAIIHSYAPADAAGHDLILVGKPTDNSGFGGASFASFELEEEKHEQNKGAVQEPNAFLGRHMIKSSNELFKKLKSMGALERVGFKDLGAGGIACASVELADTSGYGAVVEIEKIHIGSGTYEPHVILCAETQERYMWVSPPDLTQLILDHYNIDYALPEISKGAAASVIGHITEETDYIVTYEGEELVHAPAPEVTKGFLYDRPLGELPKQKEDIPFAGPVDHNALLKEILSSENVASRHPLYEQYDKQVQGRTRTDAGAGDTGIICPFNEEKYPEEIRSIGVTLTTDQNPRINKVDPFLGAVHAVVEGFCNTAASGAEAIALSDCMCYGNPEKPEQMKMFALGCEAVAATARTLKIPVIAGNVSLYNESENGSIPPSPMIAVLGKLEDADTAIGKDLESTGCEIFALGRRDARCGGSLFLDLLGAYSSEVSKPDLVELQAAARVIREAAGMNIISACHDTSEGGIATALCEMAFSRGMGIEADIPADCDMSDTVYLFGESAGFLIAVGPEHTEQFKQMCSERDVTLERLGVTVDTGRLEIGELISISLDEAHKIWKEGLRRRLA